jgi:uncharacterized OsmC-like protein
MAGRMERQPIVVTHDGGVKFVAQIRSHQVRVDQPTHAGGEDAAPAPIELLGASLGTCVALYVQQFCHARGLPYEGMRVEVQSLGAANPGRIGQFDVRVVLPSELPNHYAEMLERVARSCPAHNTLTHDVRVNVGIEVAGGVPLLSRSE